MSFHTVEMHYMDPKRCGVVTARDDTQQNVLERYPSIRQCCWNFYLSSTTFVSLVWFRRSFPCYHTRFPRSQWKQVQSKATFTQIRLVTEAIAEAKFRVRPAVLSCRTSCLTDDELLWELFEKARSQKRAKGGNPGLADRLFSL